MYVYTRKKRQTADTGKIRITSEVKLEFEVKLHLHNKIRNYSDK